MRFLSKLLLGTMTAIVLGAFASGVSAQITINIPKLPRIKKVQPTPTPDDQSSSSSNDSGSGSSSRTQDSNTAESAGPKPDHCKSDAVTQVFLEDIEKTRKQAADYTPGSRDYYVQDFNDNENKYLKSALSASRRQEWLGTWPAETVNCINPALDNLAVVARKTLPGYTPAGYNIHNLAEERLIKGQVNDLAQATVFKVGLLSTSWKIAKDDYNFPTSRYKYGMIWAKYPKLDDGFCRIIYVNVIQDYAGGGTYGDSYGRFIKSEYAGCPTK
jgi:hypothetical protein